MRPIRRSGKAGKPKVRSKGIKAYVYPDMDIENPFGWSSAVPLYKDDSSYGNEYEGKNGERIWRFCNNRFDQDRFEDMDFDDEEAMCDYLSHFGCLAVPFYGTYNSPDGILVMSSEDISKHGYKSRQAAKEHLEGIAQDYNYGVNGEVYGIMIMDSPEEPDDLYPNYVYECPDVDEDEGEEELFRVGGYFGLEHANECAEDEIKDIIAERSKSPRSKKPKAKKTSTKPKAKRR